MKYNTRKTSRGVASLAAKTLSDKDSSDIAKSLAASLISQTNTSKQTGAELETKASRVLQSNKYSKETKTLAGSVLAQSNKER